MSLLRSAARRLGLGKYRYWQGTDLQGNNFFERPHPEFPGEWRKNKRYVEYREARPLGDYDFKSIPVQWTSWLRRTRRSPPTIQELEVDLARQVRLQNNVQRLEQAYREEKLRLAEANREALSIGSTTAPTEAAEGERPAMTKEQEEGLPAKDGGVGNDNGRAAEIARELSTGEEKVEGDRIKPKEEEKNPEELAKERREKERAEAIKRREEFAREQAANPRGNPSDNAQPQGWAPGPVRRRA